MTKKQRNLKKTQWTLAEAFKDKSMSIIVLTLIGTFGLNQLINLVMSRYLSSRAQAEIGHSISTRIVEFSFGIYGIVFAIPVFIVILLLTYFLLNLSKGRLNIGEEREQIKFRWNSLYGIVIGFIVWRILIQVFLIMSVTINPIFSGIPLLIAPVIAIIVGTSLNRVMVQRTGANEDLVYEVVSGMHDGKIKEKNEERIIKILSKGDATSIRGARFRLLLNNIFNWTIGLFVKFIWFLFKWFFIAMISVFGGSSSSSRSGGYGGSEPSVSTIRAKEKSNAYAEADKLRNQANYTKKHYVNQLNYNPKHSRAEYNRALHDEKAAKEARDRANRL